MSAARILVVDDDPIVAESLAELLSQEGHKTRTAFDGLEGLRLIEEANASCASFDVVLSDVSMPRMGGTDLLKEIAQDHAGTAVIMLTGYGTIEGAVEALKLGACDFLTKPLVDDELRLALERALRERKLAKENQSLRKQLDTRFGMGGLVGADDRMKKVYELVQAVAPSKATVLMTGESGTGKSLVARSIHTMSPRAAEPFVEISCGSIPETLLESELFGHVKGAFTGAHADKVGKFEQADGGTLFLDEINSASAGMQLKLLRVLQEKRFESVGGSQTKEVDVRVILASNQPLENLVAEGRFRQDLYYRINVVKISLPPLRDRLSDIPLLAEHFLARHAQEMGRAIEGFDDDAMDALRRYTYPGNVRELDNIVQRAAVLGSGPKITTGDLPPEVVSGDGGVLASAINSSTTDGPWTPMPLVEALREPERAILLKALEANDWNRQQTADQLEINRTTLYKKMKALGIDDPDTRRAG